MGSGLNKGKGTLFDEEFLVAVAFQLNSNDFVYSTNGVAEFLIETFSFDVGTDNYMRMTGPSIKCLLIKRSCNLNALTSRSIVGPCIKLLSSNSSSHQMQHSIVSLIPDHGPGPSFLIQNSLEFFLGNIGSGVASSSIADDDGWRLAHHCQLCKVIFYVHLEPNEEALELDPLFYAELGH